MSFSPKVRYLLVTAAILAASAIQLVRGYPWLIVTLGAGSFLLCGNLAVYLSGSRERAIRRQQRRDYWAN